MNRLVACLGEWSLAAGEKIFSQGDEGDEMFLVRRGAVRIMLPLEWGKRHHLATIEAGEFFGELTFLDRVVHSADVETKASTELYVLSRRRFNEQSRSDPVVGVQVFARLALHTALRLRQTDAELRLHEER